MNRLGPRAGSNALSVWSLYTLTKNLNPATSLKSFVCCQFLLSIAWDQILSFNEETFADFKEWVCNKYMTEILYTLRHNHHTLSGRNISFKSFNRWLYIFFLKKSVFEAVTGRMVDTPWLNTLKKILDSHLSR